MNENAASERAPTDFAGLAPEAIATLARLTAQAKHSGLEPSLLELVRTRASQLNGCAYCVDMHTKDARRAGESEQRLYALTAWRETPFFSPRERAALAWTEAVTLIASESVSDALAERIRRYFTEEELVHLTLAVVAINGWNRLAIPFRTPPGSYEPAV
jgi:AhpD family alkylhydroperoxidase